MVLSWPLLDHLLGPVIVYVLDPCDWVTRGVREDIAKGAYPTKGQT